MSRPTKMARLCVIHMPTGKSAKRESITSKVFERGGMGVWGKGGENFLKKVLSSLPPTFPTPYASRHHQMTLPMMRTDSAMSPRKSTSMGS